MTLQLQVLAPATLKLFTKFQHQSFLAPFYLAGGTAIALYLGHRQSVDLDFFSSHPFQNLLLKQQLVKQGSFTVEQESQGTLHGVLDEVKVSFLEYQYPLLSPHTSFQGMQISSLEDLACMKLEAIASRGKKRDFFDLYAILFEKKKILQEVIHLFEKKYQKTHYNLMHLFKSLIYFEDAESDPNPVCLQKMDWNEIKLFFIRETRTLTQSFHP